MINRLFLSYILVTMFSFAESPKEIFAKGIKAATDVIKYEAKNIDNEVDGYCAELLSRQQPLKDHEIMKLKSLALILKLKPSTIQTHDGSDNKFCFTTDTNLTHLKKSLLNVSKQYPPIKEYFIDIVLLPKDKYKRVISLLPDKKPNPPKSYQIASPKPKPVKVEGCDLLYVIDKKDIF